MKRLLLTTFCMISLFDISAHNKVWLNGKSDIISDSIQATQYAHVFHEENVDRVEFYKLDGTHTDTKHFDKFEIENNKRNANGISKHFYANGNDSTIVSYKDNKREGPMMVYYPDGSTHISCVYHNGGLEGLFTQYYPDGKLRREEVYKDRVCTMGKLLANDGSKMVHQPYFVMPTFAGGTKSFMEILMKEVKYPEKAHRKQEFGKVIISIVIDKDGYITQPKVVKSVSKSLDKEAIRALNAIAMQHKWSPGYVDGEAKNITLSIPLVFTLPY